MASSPTASAHLPPLTERGLMRAAARGEKRAFEQIYRRYHQQLYRYCYAILRRESDAEDALQATMAAALRALPGEKRDVSLRSWLYRVAHNESITLLRGRARAADPEQAPEPARESVEAEYAGRERFRLLLADLGELPERQRGAIVMRELSSLSYEEIGAALECSAGAARQIVYESRVALQLREEGRAVSCEEIRRAVSDGDRRRLRGRKLKAHLAGCERCRDFERGIGARRTTLQAFSPVLPAAAASGIFASLSGGSAGGGVVGAALGAGSTTAVGGAGVFGGGLATATAVKGLSVAAAVIAAAGIGEATGAIDVPVANFGKSADNGGPAAGAGDGRSQGEGEGLARGSGADRGPGEAGGNGHDRKGSRDNTGRGKSDSAPGRDGSPGRSAEAPGKDGSPGNAAAAPGLDGSPGKPSDAGNSASPQGSSNRSDVAESAPGSDVSSDPPTGSGNTGKPAEAPPPEPPPKTSSTDDLLPIDKSPVSGSQGKGPLGG